MAQPAAAAAAAERDTVASLNAAGIYVVSKLTGWRDNQGCREYKVRWEGYQEEDE